MKTKENYSGFKGFVKLILNIVSWTSLVLLILLALFLAYYTISNKLAQSRGGKFEPFVSLYTIVSGSMEPNIKVYDVVVSKKVSNPSEIKVGDVITFVSTSAMSNGFTVTHRVIEVVNTEKGVGYRTQGDNNLSPDTSPALYNNVIGKVIVKIPQLGRVQEFISRKGGWLVLIVAPALYVIIVDILKIFKLVGVKNKIEKINEDNEKVKKVQERKENMRKEAIKKKLGLNSNEAFLEPILTKKRTRSVVGVETTSTRKRTTTKEGVKSRIKKRKK